MVQEHFLKILEVEILRLEVDEREFTRTCPNPFAKAPGQVEKLFFDDSDNKIQQAAIIENFATTILGKTKIYCPLAEGLGSLQIIHGAYMSSWLGREVDLPVDEKEFRRMLEER